ncbi:MAG TPA: trigger factor [Solirubrobacterales bacterium]|jgi:trigger factor
MRTQVTELPDSRVRVEVGVEPEAVKQRMERAAKALAREMRVPGFRKGKVPPQLVIQRLGREAVLEQAFQDALPEWYERAVMEAGINPVGSPQLNLEQLPAEGEELEFSFEIGVRPRAELGEYKGLEVGRTEIEVDEEIIDRELERLREGFGSLNPVERPAQSGDIVVIDYQGTIDGEPFEGSEGKDFAIELGAENLLAEFDQAITGRSAGDDVEVEVTFPDDHKPDELAGKHAAFAVKVKEVREKELPELDDDFAQLASEFDTLEELRADIRERLERVLEERADAEFREAAVEAAVANAKVDLPHDIVHARAHELWEQLERSLAARGIDPQTYARMQGKDRHELITESEEAAERQLRREATLEAIADAEGIDPTDEDLIEALGPGEGKESPEKILERLKKSGRDALLRQEVRMRKAAELVADSAKPIPKAQAEAREALWTPEKEEAGAASEGDAGGEAESGKLWTPGS